MKKVNQIDAIDINRIYNRLTKWGNHREAELVLFGCNVGLRISDILQLKFDDIHMIKFQGQLRECVELEDMKTGKGYKLPLNNEAVAAVKRLRGLNPDANYLFEATGNRAKHGHKPISRQWVSAKLKDVEESLRLSYSINTSSFRKTFFMNNHRHRYTLDHLKAALSINPDE